MSFLVESSASDKRTNGRPLSQLKMYRCRSWWRVLLLTREITENHYLNRGCIDIILGESFASDKRTNGRTLSQ
jgi:hypothetical protein